MRKIIQECRALDSMPIEDIYRDPRMCDDMPAVLKGLQFVYCNAESPAEVFTILETHFQAGTRKDVGRPCWISGASSCSRLSSSAWIWTTMRWSTGRTMIHCCGSFWGMDMRGLIRQQAVACGLRAAFDTGVDREGTPFDRSDGAQGGWKKVWGRATRSLRFQGD